MRRMSECERVSERSRLGEFWALGEVGLGGAFFGGASAAVRHWMTPEPGASMESTQMSLATMILKKSTLHIFNSHRYRS